METERWKKWGKRVKGKSFVAPREKHEIHQSSSSAFFRPCMLACRCLKASARPPAKLTPSPVLFSFGVSRPLLEWPVLLPMLTALSLGADENAGFLLPGRLAGGAGGRFGATGGGDAVGGETICGCGGGIRARRCGGRGRYFFRKVGGWGPALGGTIEFFAKPPACGKGFVSENGDLSGELFGGGNLSKGGRETGRVACRCFLFEESR